MMSCIVNIFFCKRKMPKIFFWKQIYFYAVIIILYSLTFVNSAKINQFKVCGPSSKNPQSLIFVSTLDGKVSALDAANNGKKLWALDFGKSPMLSSNIHRRELNNNGQWVRLIPSLGGGLYKFDGENLEKLPVTTEQLLSLSFRYSDDLVFSGGKETRSYGVLSTTGKILYECKIDGCRNYTTTDTHIDKEILVIQHFQQTVRAVEPHSGAEKWNFSVGQHELLLTSNQDMCHDGNIPEFELKVIVPEGLIWAVKKNSPSVKLWQYKFDSPIVTIWQKENTKNINNNKGLKEVNLFDNSQWIWGSEFAIGPSIYIGMHDRQLYVQENAQVYKSLGSSSTKFTLHSQIPWQPYPAIGTALITNPLSIKENDKNNSFEITDVQSTTALSVMYNSEYINGNGFYLYLKEHLQSNRNNQSCNDSNILITSSEDNRSFYEEIDDEYDNDETPVQVIIVSLWYWWKEVLVISITTALLLNFIWTQHLLNRTAITKDAIPPPLIIERHIECKNVNEITDQGQNVNFKSRYLTDFEPIDCLGKGGYGVVFEAKNKIDECNYAIKRIALPNSQDSRERVMREVKALAKLDHCNIVRYFNAWLECPPIEWLEEHDREWISKENFLSSEFLLNANKNEKKCDGSTCINVSISERSSVDSACEAYVLNHESDDSFVVFEHSEKLKNEENVIDIGSSNTENSDSQCSKDNNLKDDDDSFFSQNVPSFGSNNKLSRMEEYKKRRKSSLSINLKEKSNNRKSTKMFLYIQMQLCQRLSLREWLKKEMNPRDSSMILNIFHQIVDAVEYVHLQGLIHRDLKPSNIFFAYDDKIKIGDFGLVTAMTEGYKETYFPSDQSGNNKINHNLHTSCVGTQLYMSPEQMNGQIYDYKVDIYSLGIIFFELLMSFDTEMERIINLTNLRRLSFPKNFDIYFPAEYTLLKIMLDERPEKRPTTLGIKARPPLSHYGKKNGFRINESSEWHFELPQLARYSSVTNGSSNNESQVNTST
ncbi:eukaryotic translation initiation factor 2-alpha kinase-like [Vespa mandarinia]|uniref:eukaryotic translation initiation factor 2-alpha kinase-like n=1 Tax=Vespa mandarinia TaxID=7446 RepID=UPI001617A24B|nr:eukaryotic translation initiation factor 2-alpha kinase-like [Vespa mandarinia]